MYWNGTDPGITSYNPYNAYSLNANTSFGPFSYTLGYDLGGAALYTGGNKVISFLIQRSNVFYDMVQDLFLIIF